VAWVAVNHPGGVAGWLLTITLFCAYFAAACVLTVVVAVIMLYDAYRNGSEIIFDDELTVRYPWPCRTRLYAWSEIARVEAIDEQMVVRETEFWVPLPLGAIVPGSEFVLGVEFYRERKQSVRKFRIVHVDGRKLVEIPSTTQLTFTIVRWLSRKTLYDVVTALGGRVEWKKDAPQLVSLSGSKLSANEWVAVRQQLASIRGLEEIDLSGTTLDDGALGGLDSFPSLRCVKARGTRFSQEALGRLNAALAARQSAGRFDFLT
jgi:hypothetical protein